MSKVQLIILICFSIALSGCSQKMAQQSVQQVADNISDIEDMNFDAMDIKATILSIKRGGVIEPNDTAKIRIDDIHYSSRDPDWEALEPGEEITVEFKYSARPVRIEYREESNTGKKGKKGGSFGIKVTKENNQFVYSIPTHSVKEGFTLPGVNEGDRINFDAYYKKSYKPVRKLTVIIHDYEIIENN